MTSRVATLWVGKTLGFLEQLCLKSFASVGQTPLLFSYEAITNLPDYVEHRDAREVFPDTPFFRDPVHGSPAVHADLFRLHLMAKTDHIWIDADVYALNPLIPRDGYLVAGLKPRKQRIQNSIMRLPRDSEGLRGMLDFIGSTDCTPPWWERKKAAAFRQVYNTAPTLAALPLGALGPELLYHFLIGSGESGRLLDERELYALPFSSQPRWMLAPVDDLDEFDWKSRNAIHFFASYFRQRLDRCKGRVHPESLVASMAREQAMPLPDEWLARSGMATDIAPDTRASGACAPV